MDSAHSIIPFSGSKSKASVERLSYIGARVPRLDNTCTRTHSDLRKRVFIHATPPLVNGERETVGGRPWPKRACSNSLSLSFLSALLFFHEWIYTRYIASFSPPVRFSTLVTVALFISILFRLYIYIYSMLFTVHHFDYWFWLYLNVLAYFYNTFLILKFRLIDSLSIDEVSFVSVIQGVPRSPVCFTSRKECCTNIDLLYYIEEKFILFPNVVLLRARTWR